MQDITRLECLTLRILIKIKYLKKSYHYTVIATSSIFELMMETAESKLDKEYEDYQDFTQEFDKEEKLIDNKFSIKELIENVQNSNLNKFFIKKNFYISQQNENFKIITKFFYMEGYIGLFLHKIIANEKKLYEIISYINKLIKVSKEKEGENYSGIFEDNDIIDLQYFLSPESFYDRNILKDLKINYEQLSKEPQIYTSN